MKCRGEQCHARPIAGSVWGESGDVVRVGCESGERCGGGTGRGWRRCVGTVWDGMGVGHGRDCGIVGYFSSGIDLHWYLTAGDDAHCMHAAAK
jgi:hypothetical protein